MMDGLTRYYFRNDRVAWTFSPVLARWASSLMLPIANDSIVPVIKYDNTKKRVQSTHGQSVLSSSGEAAKPRSRLLVKTLSGSVHRVNESCWQVAVLIARLVAVNRTINNWCNNKSKANNSIVNLTVHRAGRDKNQHNQHLKHDDLHCMIRLIHWLLSISSTDSNGIQNVTL